jgi:large subunit ribosomal protein L49
VDKHPDVEVIYNPPEWKYVEQLIGNTTIPKPTVKSEYPSGWAPPDPSRYNKLPYFVGRTRNFMMPVYLAITFRGQRRVTRVKFIEGDIWKLEAELHELIEKRTGKTVYSQINEMNRQIQFKGDYVTLIEKYLFDKGL